MFTPDCLSLLSCYEYRRKTDFFSGASPEKIEEILLKVVRKQQSLNASTMEAKKKEQEKEEKKRRERIQREKEKEAEEKRKEYIVKKRGALKVATLKNDKSNNGLVALSFMIQSPFIL